LRALAPDKKQTVANAVPSLMEDPQDMSLQELSQQGAQLNAPLMDAIMRTRAPAPLSIVKVVILEYSRNDSWFRRALMEGPELDEVRLALHSQGLNPELSSGAKCFAPPSLFPGVVQALHDGKIELDRRHVVVAQEIEGVVKRAIENGQQLTTRRERGSFKMKARTEINLPSEHDAQQPEQQDLVCPPLQLVKRTFIHVPVPSSMRSASSEHPRTA